MLFLYARCVIKLSGVKLIILIDETIKAIANLIFHCSNTGYLSIFHKFLKGAYLPMCLILNSTKTLTLVIVINLFIRRKITNNGQCKKGNLLACFFLYKSRLMMKLRMFSLKNFTVIQSDPFICNSVFHQRCY